MWYIEGNYGNNKFKFRLFFKQIKLSFNNKSLTEEISSLLGFIVFVLVFFVYIYDVCQ